jgi:TetR/AcrR family transcriptional regulator
MRRPAKELGPRANRTIAQILAATKEIFLTRGFAGTTMDEISRVADVSRGSVYTYFPTKRDILLALGADSASAANTAIDRLVKAPLPWRYPDLEAFVSEYFAVLEDYGSFAFAWTQAAHEDEELRVAGMKGHLVLCRRLGTALGTLRGRPFDDPAAQGLVTFSVLERAWQYCQLYTGTIDQQTVERDIAYMLGGTLR